VPRNPPGVVDRSPKYLKYNGNGGDISEVGRACLLSHHKYLKNKGIDVAVLQHGGRPSWCCSSST
jgi:hypothetical protein